jgi:Na+-transporting NADH:ubiquinone oxidoreductase subunit B
MRLRRYLDRAAPLYLQDGKYARYAPLYKLLDNFLYTPGSVTGAAPHVRQVVDLKRYMALLFIAVLPCVIAGIWNTGYQANSAIVDAGMIYAPDWRGAITGWVGIGQDPASTWSNLWLGSLYFMPLLIVTALVALFWEALFAVIGKYQASEGSFIIALLFTLTLPAGIPLWQAAIGISFGVVIGREIFGGTGMNLVNPALAGRAFLYFTYPEQISGNEVWTAVDGFSGATMLALAKSGGMDVILSTDLTWSAAFLGQMQGSIGETSTLACLVGAVFLVHTGLVSWRVIAGVMIGMIFTSLCFNWIGSTGNPMFGMPWSWHLVLGGFAFGMVFLATDPVTSSATDAGRWIYGILIGILVIVVRITNPVSPEGMMFAILLANIFAPTIDHIVVRRNIRRRRNYSASARYFADKPGVR